MGGRAAPCELWRRTPLARRLRVFPSRTLRQLLQRQLDGQLQTDAGMPHAYYGILAVLSELPPAPPG